MPARCAIFVDAAFLRASVGDLLFGPDHRSRLVVDHRGLLADLVKVVCERSRTDLLRTYWYDGAVDRVPTAEQRRIAQLPSVRVRLGRVVAGHQKGVDVLLVLDLLGLAATRTVDTIHLLSGDADLVEVVRAVQDLGVRVVLLGAATSAARHAEALIAEADGVELFGEELWRRHVVAADAGAVTARTGHPPRAPQVAAVPLGAVQTFERVGFAFGVRWLDEATDEEVERIVGSRPRIPGHVDARLLSSAGRDLGEGERVALRDGFWRALDEELVDDDGGDGDDDDDGDHPPQPEAAPGHEAGRDDPALDRADLDGAAGG